jgi:hypothetical protein
MTRRTCFRIEELETRATPSVSPTADFVFLPPGLSHARGDPDLLPPPGTSGAFLPLGLSRGVD